MGSIRLARFIAVVATALIAGACSSLQPLPGSIYADDTARIYERLPPQLQSTDVDLLYVTDRKPEYDDEGNLRYGIGRSQSLAFGSVVVKLDKSRSWDELVAWTRSEGPRNPAPTPEVVSITELVRFPDTPFPLTVDDIGQVVNEPAVKEEHVRMRDLSLGELRRRLALTDRKELNVSVHGVGTDFAKTARTLAMTWHQRGRKGVPIYYAWPAGQSGFLRGYSYDRESGEFTIFHLKQLLRLLGRLPEVENVNLVAHSRGTDILISAIRELIIEARAAGLDPLEVYHFGHIVLIAPDMDLEVITQRVAAEGVFQGVKKVTVYVSEEDWAIKFSKSLFSSKRRLGQLNPENFTERQLHFVRKVANIDVIFYKGSSGGVLGHSYYETPEVKADLILLSEGRPIGAEYGRPLEPIAPHLWILRDGYAPGP
jgi:esterase/lipase superfamily enzyme